MAVTGLLQPEYPWEFVQIGTRVVTDRTRSDHWLLLIYGVGSLCENIQSARFLLDKKDPSSPVPRSQELLVYPEPTEREGYVPNVAYSCGAMRLREQLFSLYATILQFYIIKIKSPMQALGFDGDKRGSGRGRILEAQNSARTFDCRLHSTNTGGRFEHVSNQRKQS